MCGTDTHCGCTPAQEQSNIGLVAPRFVQAVSMAQPLKGYVNGGYQVPGELPGQIMTQDGHLGLYEDLYGGVDAEGNAAMVGYAGTWGALHQAGKA